MSPLRTDFEWLLKNAGLTGLPLCWNWDGDIFFDPSVDDKMQQQVLVLREQYYAMQSAGTYPVSPTREDLLVQLDTATTLSQVRTAVKQLFGA